MSQMREAAPTPLGNRPDIPNIPHQSITATAADSQEGFSPDEKRRYLLRGCLEELAASSMTFRESGKGGTP